MSSSHKNPAMQYTPSLGYETGVNASARPLHPDTRPATALIHCDNLAHGLAWLITRGAPDTMGHRAARFGLQTGLNRAHSAIDSVQMKASWRCVDVQKSVIDNAIRRSAKARWAVT
ncbi:hypothetical protein DN30_3618 [Vibrio cholerae]|nr:hypothetical protein DN30_3618 [Vibrio cholerae]